MKVMNLLIGLLLLTTPTVAAANINLVSQAESDVADAGLFKELPKTTIIGATIDSKYYTVIIYNDTIKKVELNGKEATAFNINTTSDDVQYMFCNQEMDAITKSKFLIDIGFPFHFIQEFALDIIRKEAGVN